MKLDDDRPAGYSGTPLVRKLGLEAGMTCAAIDPPEHYLDLLVGAPGELSLGALSDSAHDFIHVFVRERDGASRGVADLARTDRP
jgi:hypothetical protein